MEKIKLMYSEKKNNSHYYGRKGLEKSKSENEMVKTARRALMRTDGSLAEGLVLGMRSW